MAIFQSISEYIESHCNTDLDENYWTHVMYWFLGIIAIVLFICLLFDKAFITTNEHGLYMDRSGSITSKACNVYRAKIWLYLHCPFFIKKTSAKLDDDHTPVSSSNKYQVIRQAINNEVTKFFNPSSRMSRYSTTKEDELSDYKSKNHRFMGVPNEYLSPDYIMSTFLKFLSHKTYKEVQQLAKKLNAGEVDLEKCQFLDEECGICLDSVYLPKNDITNKYEAKCSSIKLMCGHKFHFSCFIQNTYRTWGTDNVVLSESGIHFPEPSNTLAPTTESDESVDEQPVSSEESALSKHRAELRKKLLDNIKKQHESTEITPPPKNTNLAGNTHVLIHSRSTETIVEDSNSEVEKPVRNNFNNTATSVEYIDNASIEQKLLIEKTLQSRVDRKCHCPLCRLDVELVVAYLKSKDLEVENCQVI